MWRVGREHAPQREIGIALASESHGRQAKALLSGDGPKLSGPRFLSSIAATLRPRSSSFRTIRFVIRSFLSKKIARGEAVPCMDYDREHRTASSATLLDGYQPSPGKSVMDESPPATRHLPRERLAKSGRATPSDGRWLPGKHARGKDAKSLLGLGRQVSRQARRRSQ